MGVSSDISRLFKQFGGSPDHYQEIVEKDTQQDSLARWPGMARVDVRSSALAPVAAVTTPQVLFEVAAVSSPAPIDIPAKTPEAVAPKAPARGAESLQSLLGKLSQQPLQAPLIERNSPSLDNIQVIAVMSAKGGVGKSTLTANLAAALQKLGRAVLTVDLDPQNALYHHFSAAGEPIAPLSGLGFAQTDEALRELCQMSSAGVFVLPYGEVDETQRSAFETDLREDPNWLAHRLHELQLADGAIILLDTPPGPSIYLQQALSVANLALVVSLSDAASYTALPLADKLIGTYSHPQRNFAGAAYLINQVDSSRQLSKDIAQIMRDALGSDLLGLVHRDQAVSEALAYNRNVLDYDPNGQGCQDILACAQALLARLSVTARREQLA